MVRPFKRVVAAATAPALFPSVARAEVVVRARSLEVTSSTVEDPDSDDFPLALGRAIEEAREEGRRVGLEEGQRRGREAAERELAKLSASLNVALTAAATALRTDMKSLETRVAELALAVAARLVRCEVDAGRYDLQARLEEALQHVRERSRAVIRLHPDDLVRLDPDSGPAHPEWVADAALSRGDVVIETPGGRVFHAFEEQLERIGRAIRTGEAGV